MATITFELKTQGRTADDFYKDVALTNGYETTVESTVVEDTETDLLTEQERDDYVYPDNVVEGSKSVLPYTQDDSTVMYKISYQTSITTIEPNPITDIEFGKIVSDKKFAGEDIELQGNAVKARARGDYNI